jgi:ribose transport system substrate-binding protein
MKGPRIKLSLGLAAMFCLIAIVLGAVAGRASTDSGGGGGSAGPAAVGGKRVDVIIKASDSSFWQTMLAGAKKAGDDFGLKVSLFGPTSETDVNEQVQLMENSISRGVDAIAIASNSSDALNDVIKRARKAGIKVITVDNPVTTTSDGFIGTDSLKAGETGGRRLCDLLKKQGRTSGEIIIESAVAGVQVLETRDQGFKKGLAETCPDVKVATTRYNNNDINTAAGQVNDAITSNRDLLAVFADNNVSGDGASRAIKDNKAEDKIPVVAFDSDPAENAALADGSIDALVVQNPYFFGYQGVLEAAMATVKGNFPPLNLDPGAVVVDKSNMKQPEVARLLKPPTEKL